MAYEEYFAPAPSSILGPDSPEAGANNREFNASSILAPEEYIGYVPNAPVAEPVYETDEMGEFMKGVNRGIDNLQALSAGAVGYLGEVLDIDMLRDWGYDEYLAQIEEAAQYSPEVASYKDAAASPAAFVSYVAGITGELGPSVLQSVASVIAGSLAGSAAGPGGTLAGGVAGLVGKGALKTFLKNQVKKYVASGMSKKAAASAALKKFGASAALVATTGAQATGGMYASDVEEYGLGNVPTSQLVSAAALGAASGGLELLGIEGAIANSNIIRRVTGQVLKPATEARLARRLASHMATGGLGEGATEGMQQVLEIFHSEGLDISPEGWDQIKEAAVAGGIGGMLFGGANTVLDYPSRKAKAIDNKEVTGDENVTAEDLISEADTKIEAAEKVISGEDTAAVDPLDKKIAGVIQAQREGKMDPVSAAVELTKLNERKLEAQKKAKQDATGELRKWTAKKQTVTDAVLKQRSKSRARQRWEQTTLNQLNYFYNDTLARARALRDKPGVTQAEFMQAQRTLATLPKEIDKLVKMVKTEPTQAATELAIQGMYATVESGILKTETDRAVRNEQRSLSDREYEWLEEINNEKVRRRVTIPAERAARRERILNRRAEREAIRAERQKQAQAGRARMEQRLRMKRAEQQRWQNEYESQRSADVREAVNRQRQEQMSSPEQVMQPYTPGITRDIGTPGVYPQQITAAEIAPTIQQQEVGITPATKAPLKRSVPVHKTGTKVPQAYQWVETTLQKLPQLRDEVFIVRNNMDERVPSHLREKMKGIKGAFIQETGKIYIFADNIRSKRDAIRVLIHEGVAHHGLRRIMNTREFERFMSTVYWSVADTKRFKQLILDDPRYSKLDMMAQAEEYVARIAERTKLGHHLNKNEKKVWNRIKNLFQQIFKRLGLVRITDKEIGDVISASIFNLARTRNPKAYRKEWTTQKDILEVRASTMGRSIMADLVSSPQKLYMKMKKEFQTTFNEHAENGRARNATTTDKFITAMQDNMRRMKVVQRAVKKMGGKVTEYTNVYKNEEVVHNKINQHLQKFMDEHVYGKDGLVELIHKSAREGKTQDQAMFEVDQIAYALHAIERNAEIARRTNGQDQSGSGMTNDEAHAIIKKATPAQMQAVQKIHELNNYRLDLLGEFGLIPKSVIAEWRKTYKTYVPLKGWEEMVSEQLPKYMQGNRGLDIGSKDMAAYAKGRGSKASSPMINTIKQIEDTIRIGHTNEVTRGFLGLVEDNKQFDKMWELEEDMDNAFYRSLDKKTGEITFKKASSKFRGRIELADGTVHDMADLKVTVIDNNGQRRHILVKDAELARALKGANVQVGGKLTTILQKSMRMLSQLSTTWNPDFWLTNAVRDFTTSFINLGDVKVSEKLQGEFRTKLWKDYKDSYRAVYKTLLHGKSGTEYDVWFERMKKYGGFTHMYDLKDFTGLSNKMQKELKLMGDTTTRGNLMRLGKTGLEYIEATTTAFENATRLIAFKNTAELLKSEKGMAPELAYKRAASLALNLTVNFTKKGTHTSAIGSLYLFFNAAVQANARLLKTIFRNKQQFAKVAGGLVVGSLMWGMVADAIGGEDDDGVSFYDKLPRWERENNLIFMMPGGKYFKLPLPYGFNIFHVFAQNLYTVGKKTAAGSADLNDFADVLTNSLKSAFDNFIPMGAYDEGITMMMPSMIRPVVQILANENYFGKPIYPEQKVYHKGEYPDSQRYWDDVSFMSKTFTDLLNTATGGTKFKAGAIDISPESIDHLIQSWAGGLGSTITRVGGVVEKILRGAPEHVDLNEIPVLRRFGGDAGNIHALNSQYAEAKTKIEIGELNLEDAKAEGKSTLEVHREFKKELRLRGSLKSAQSRLRRIGTELSSAREAYTRGKLSFADYLDRKETLEKQRERALKAFLARVDKVGL